jgi:TolA-binding protein
VHFERGWRALQASAYGEAIEGFNAAMMLKGPLAQDARWWHAVALGRAGREAAMRRALRRFIGRYPTAARAAEAQVMLGWSLFAAGQIEAAEKAFAQGSRAARPAARKSAAAGQRAIREWRAQRER